MIWSMCNLQVAQVDPFDLDSVPLTGSRWAALHPIMCLLDRTMICSCLLQLFWSGGKALQIKR